jgi:hypothetical protein
MYFVGFNIRSYCFSVNIYVFLIHKNYTFWRWLFNSITYFSTKFPSPSAALRQRGTCVITPSRDHALSCSRSHSDSECHEAQTLYGGLHPSGPQTSGNLTVFDWGWGLDGITQSKQISWWLSDSCLRFCIFRLNQDFCWILVRPNLFEPLSELCQCPDVGVQFDRLPSRQSIQKNHSKSFSFWDFEDVIPCNVRLSQVATNGRRFHML